MKYSIKFSLTIVLIIQSFILLAGGGWPQEKNKGYFKISEWWLIANQHYTSQGFIDPNVTAGLFNTNIYAEYGFTNKLTGIVNFPIFSRATVNNVRSNTTGDIIFRGDAINGIGDLDLGLKYGLFKNDFISVSGSLIAGLALGESAGGEEKNLQLGDGEYNQFLRVDAGIPFKVGKINAYSNFYGGYNNRTNGFSDEYRFGGEIGFGFLKKKLWLVGKSDIVRSTFNGKTAGQVNTSVFANNAEFVAVQLEAAYQVTKHVGFSASYASAVSGKIIYAAPSYSVGVFYKM